MAKADFEFDEVNGQENQVAGTPEGDGDFESDNLPSTGETSAGGQVLPPEDPQPAPETNEFLKVMDEISTGKLQP